jgi:hypothetical protein
VFERALAGVLFLLVVAVTVFVGVPLLIVKLWQLKRKWETTR